MIDAVCRSRLTSNISSRVMLVDTYAPDDDDDDDDDDDGDILGVIGYILHIQSRELR